MRLPTEPASKAGSSTRRSLIAAQLDPIATVALGLPSRGRHVGQPWGRTVPWYERTTAPAPRFGSGVRCRSRWRSVASSSTTSTVSERETEHG